MRAEQQRLLDIGGARGAGDEVERARRLARAVASRAAWRTRSPCRRPRPRRTRTTTWLSGRKLSVVGLSAPEISASVPVSAMAAKATLAALRSWPSEGPWLISSEVSRPGQAGEARIGADAQRRGQVVVAQVAGDLGRDVRRATRLRVSVAAARSASSLKLAIGRRARARGITPEGVVRQPVGDRRAARRLGARSHAASGGCCAKMSSRALIAPRPLFARQRA